LRDHIKRPEIAFVSWRVGLDRADDDAFVEAFEKIADGSIVAQSFNSNSKPGPNDPLPRD
jgi:hypothetical protein